MYQLEITHPKPAPTQSEIAALVGQKTTLCGGGADDRVYGFLFEDPEEADRCGWQVMARYPMARFRVEPYHD